MGRKVTRIYASPELAAVIRASQRQRRLEQAVLVVAALLVFVLAGLLMGCSQPTAPRPACTLTDTTWAYGRPALIVTVESYGACVTPRKEAKP